MEPLRIYPDAESYAIAGIYDIDIGENPKIDLSDYICIAPRDEYLDRIYLKRARGFSEPPLYLIGYSKERNYIFGGRKILNPEDCLSSLLIAQQSLCIYNACPCRLGPIYSFGINTGATVNVLYNPTTPKYIHEIDHPVLKNVRTEFWTLPLNRVNNGFQDFFVRVSEAYSKINNRSWILAAQKYTDGITSLSMNEAIIDLAIALEALLCKDKDQIGYKVRLYTAILVGTNLKERKQIINDVKKFYNLRSQLVHGEHVEFTREDIDRTKRMSNYISKALITTCSWSQKQIFDEIEYLTLLGEPKFTKRKAMMVLTEDEIAKFLASLLDVEGKYDYEAYLSEPDEDGDRELIIKMMKDGEILGELDAFDYLWRMPQLTDVNLYSYYVSEKERGQYCIVVEYIEK